MAVPRKRPLVLVVEDDPALGDVMLTALKDDGLDAKLAHDGDEAMRDVDDLSPAVMVLDLCSRTSDWFDSHRGTPIAPLAERYVQAALRIVGAEAA